MPPAVFSFTNNNPFYYKQSSAVKTIAVKFKQWLRASTYCYNDRSAHLTLLTLVIYEVRGSSVITLSHEPGRPGIESRGKNFLTLHRSGAAFHYNAVVEKSS